jgi:hypothetical protein
MAETTLVEALEQAKRVLANFEQARVKIDSQIDLAREEVRGLELAVARVERSTNAKTVVPAGSSGAVVPATLVTPADAAKKIAESGFAAPGGVSIGMSLAVLVTTLLSVYKDWKTDKRATAVERVLREAGVPLHRTMITNALAELGRTGDNLGDVSAALAYLHRAKRVRPVGDGNWEYIPPDKPRFGTTFSSPAEVADFLGGTSK